jgi:hypothetical protein
MRKILALALCLAGCASSGTKVSQQTFGEFSKGKSTCSEIQGRLGAPTQSLVKPDGDLVLAYVYAAAQAHPENFVPVVNIFAHGYDSEQTVALFKCDTDGVLIKTAYMQGGQGTGMNVEGVAQGRKDTGTTE